MEHCQSYTPEGFITLTLPTTGGIMTILDYNSSLKPVLEEMLVAYFPEVSSDIPEDIIRGKLLNLIHDQVSRRIIHISVGMLDDDPVGFSIYQIDREESDWCKYPGWGFIREFYIRKEYRHRGYGTRLAAYTEEQLHLLGAETLYLTTGDADAFWVHCGYHNSGTICSNGLPVFTKNA